VKKQPTVSPQKAPAMSKTMSTPVPGPGGKLLGVGELEMQRGGSEMPSTAGDDTMGGTVDGTYNADLESSGEPINVLIGTDGINVTDLN